MTDDEAHRIAQDFLDRQGEAVIAGDVEAIVDWCDIPCTLESTDGRALVTNRANMRAICVAFIDKLKAKQLTHMVRTCLEAKFKDEDTVWATYETRYVLDGKSLTEDLYVSFVVLRAKKDQWKISAMQFAADGKSPANSTLRELMRKKEGV